MTLTELNRRLNPETTTVQQRNAETRKRQEQRAAVFAYESGRFVTYAKASTPEGV